MSNPPILEECHVVPDFLVTVLVQPKAFVCLFVFFLLNYLECQMVVSSFAFSLNVVHTFNAKNKVLIDNNA